MGSSDENKALIVKFFGYKLQKFGNEFVAKVENSSPNRNDFFLVNFVIKQSELTKKQRIRVWKFEYRK